jgi:hypothetical protein
VARLPAGLRPIQRHRAQELFAQNDLRALPVVEDLAGRRVLGMVRRSDVARLYLKHLHGPQADGRPRVG